MRAAMHPPGDTPEARTAANTRVAELEGIGERVLRGLEADAHGELAHQALQRGRSVLVAVMAYVAYLSEAGGGVRYDEASLRDLLMRL